MTEFRFFANLRNKGFVEYDSFDKMREWVSCEEKLECRFFLDYISNGVFVGTIYPEFAIEPIGKWHIVIRRNKHEGGKA